MYVYTYIHSVEQIYIYTLFFESAQDWDFLDRWIKKKKQEKKKIKQR